MQECIDELQRRRRRLTPARGSHRTTVVFTAIVARRLLLMPMMAHPFLRSLAVPDDTGESDWLLERFRTIEDLQREWEKEREEGG